MINKKNLDRSFSALYTLKKRNLLVQTGKGKKPEYSSEEILLTRAIGLDDILSDFRSTKDEADKYTYDLTKWITFDGSTFQTYITPGPMALAAQGGFYIGNTFTPTSQITQVDSNGNLLNYYNPPSGIVSAPTAGWPWGIAYYNGILYASDMGGGFIYKLEMLYGANTWEVLLGLPGTNGNVTGIGGPGTLTRLFSPVGIISDNNGILYFTQGDNFIISKYVISTNTLTTFAGTGLRGFLDGPGTSAQFNIPTGLFFDETLANIIVCDNQNNRIRKINIATQEVTTIAGTGVGGNLDGPVASATFNFPGAGCCDYYGNIYIADDRDVNGVREESLIRKISNGVVTTLYNGFSRGMPPKSNISHLFFSDGYVYCSEQVTANTYRFKVRP